MNILIVEDDNLIADSIGMALEDEGHIYQITNTAEDEGHIYQITNTAEDGLNAIRENNYDAVILDINLPDGDGFQFAKSQRQSKIDTSVLVVSGRASVTDKVVALRFGADGYLTKPFDRQELIANLTAIIRRAHGHSDNKIVTGPIMVDLNKHEVIVGNKRLNLTSKEYHILELLSLRKVSTQGKTHFLSHLYGGIDEPESKIIDVFICKLRRKICALTGGDNYIHTVWGQGYVLRDHASG